MGNEEGIIDFARVHMTNTMQASPQDSEWVNIALYVALCTIMAISRREEARI